MKYFVLVIVGVLFAVVNGSGKEDECPLAKAFRSSVEACKDKLSDENLELLSEDENADNEEIRCFKACILTDSGMMENGKIQVDRIKSALNKAAENAEEDKEKVKEIVETLIEATEDCAEEAEKGKNECETAHLFISCIQKMDDEE